MRALFFLLLVGCGGAVGEDSSALQGGIPRRVRLRVSGAIPRVPAPAAGIAQAVSPTSAPQSFHGDYAPFPRDAFDLFWSPPASGTAAGYTLLFEYSGFETLNPSVSWQFDAGDGYDHSVVSFGMPLVVLFELSAYVAGDCGEGLTYQGQPICEGPTTPPLELE